MSFDGLLVCAATETPTPAILLAIASVFLTSAMLAIVFTRARHLRQSRSDAGTPAEVQGRPARRRRSR